MDLELSHFGFRLAGGEAGDGGEQRGDGVVSCGVQQRIKVQTTSFLYIQHRYVLAVARTRGLRWLFACFSAAAGSKALRFTYHFYHWTSTAREERVVMIVLGSTHFLTSWGRFSTRKTVFKLVTTQACNNPAACGSASTAAS